MNLIYLASKELFRPETLLVLHFPRKDRLLLSDLMHELADLGLQTSKRVRVYSDSLKLGKKVNPKIWGLLGSHQLLHLQRFPKILNNFGTLLYLELVSFLLVSSLFDFGLWISKRLPEVLVAITHGFSSFK